MISQLTKFQSKMNTDLAFFETTLRSCGDFASAGGVLPGADVAIRPNPQNPEDMILGRVIAYYADIGFYDVADVDDSKRQVLLDEAVVCYSRALDAKSEELGREHPDTIVTMHNLAEALLAAGREEAGTAVQQGIIDVLKPDDTQEDTDRQRQGDDLRARERTIRDMLTRNPSSRDA